MTRMLWNYFSDDDEIVVHWSGAPGGLVLIDTEVGEHKRGEDCANCLAHARATVPFPYVAPMRFTGGPKFLVRRRGTFGNLFTTARSWGRCTGR